MAFLQSLFKNRFIPLVGEIPKSVQEVAASGIPVKCDIIQIDIEVQNLIILDPLCFSFNITGA